MQPENVKIHWFELKQRMMSSDIRFNKMEILKVEFLSLSLCQASFSGHALRNVFLNDEAVGSLSSLEIPKKQ